MSPSKLSLHLSGYPDGIYERLAPAHLHCIKIFNQTSEMNVERLRSVLAPGALMVYRHYTVENYDTITADQFVDELIRAGLLGDGGKLARRGLIWEGINEPECHSPEDLQCLGDWYVRFGERMHALGEKTAAFSFSTGNPTKDLLGTLGVLAPGILANDYIALHEYLLNAFWYREIWNHLPVKKPVLFTEGGYDTAGDPFTSGYHAHNITDDQMMVMLADYDAELLKDDYVMAVLLYQVGDGNWPSFELQGMVPRIVAHVCDQGGGAPGAF